jgi:2-keto-3-deoxy-L-rhamnonate aldolase RhmA
MRTSNEEILLIVMTEDQRGLSEISEIAAVDGVDLISLGPTDISTALGITDPTDPRLKQTFQELAAKVKAVGKAKVYIPVNHSALNFSPRDLLDMGVSYTSVAPAPPTIVLNALRGSAQRIREEAGQKSAV